MLVSGESARDNPVNSELIEIIRDKLKPNYKIGMLSNAGGNWLGELFEAKDLELFDAVALSYEIGAMKPDVSAYETISTRLDVLPGECVFIDDNEGYCAAAEATGMTSIYYKNNQDLRKVLQNYNIIRIST